MSNTLESAKRRNIQAIHKHISIEFLFAFFLLSLLQNCKKFFFQLSHWISIFLLFLQLSMINLKNLILNSVLNNRNPIAQL